MEKTLSRAPVRDMLIRSPQKPARLFKDLLIRTEPEPTVVSLRGAQKQGQEFAPAVRAVPVWAREGGASRAAKSHVGRVTPDFTHGTYKKPSRPDLPHESARFTPSVQLGSFVLRKAVSIREDDIGLLNLDDLVGSEPLPMLSLESAREQLSEQVHLVLAILGNGLQERGNFGTLKIASNGRFRPFFIEPLLHDVPVDEYELPEFLVLLHQELKALASMSRLGGLWGYLRVEDDGDLTMVVTEVPARFARKAREPRRNVGTIQIDLT